MQGMEVSGVIGAVAGILLCFPGWFLFRLLSLMLHEAGHAMMALGAGCAAVRLEMGEAPFRKALSMGRVKMVWGRRPWKMAHCRYQESRQVVSVRRIALGGPMVSLFLGFAGLFMVARLPLFFWPLAVVFLAVNLKILLTSLLPGVSQGQAPSDGDFIFGRIRR